MSKFGVPYLKNFLKYAADMKTFFEGLFTPFLGLTFLYFVNIQPNSKFHPPTKIFWIFLSARSFLVGLPYFHCAKGGQAALFFFFFRTFFGH